MKNHIWSGLSELKNCYFSGYHDRVSAETFVPCQNNLGEI